jgi:hypothetical protein
MTNVLQWRKTTWILVLWGGYVPAWAVITGAGPAIVVLWWLAGAIVFGVLWLATQPLFRPGRGFSGIFSWPRRPNWRVVDLRRAHEATECRRDEGESGQLQLSRLEALTACCAYGSAQEPDAQSADRLALSNPPAVDRRG